MTKYEPLKRLLRDVRAERHPMTFAEIEQTLGFPLPRSASKHRAWWSNNPATNVMARVWRDAGWITSEVDMEKRTLMFRREKERIARGSAATESQVHTGPISESPSSRSRDLLIRDLDPLLWSKLESKAGLRGTSMEEVARQILAAGADLTPEERTVLADSIAAMGPPLLDVDVVQWIREDRDSR